MLPAKVEEYFPDEQKVDVKPLIKRRIVGEEGEELLEELPIIPDVPVRFPRNANFFMTFPLAPGDLVMLVFAERSLDNWLAGTGEDTDPDEFRMHDITDAVACPGLYPFSEAIGDIDTERMALGHKDDGMQIHIAEDHIEVTLGGETRIKAEAEKVDVTLGGASTTIEGSGGDTKMTVGDGAKHVAIVEHLEALWGDLKTAMDTWDTHTHPTGVGPSGPAAQPSSVPAWDGSINSTKVSIPDG